jgi:hypothetical protein
MLQVLNEAFDLIDGKLFWKQDRPKEHFLCSRGYNTWKRYAGKPVTTRPGTHGYKVVTISYKRVAHHYLQHVVIYAMAHGEFPCNKVDHSNGDRLDNVPSNLTNVSDSGNAKNCSRRRDNTTGVTGVTWDKQTSRYRVQGRSEFTSFRPKRVADFFEAVCIRKSWELLNEFSSRHGSIKEVA